MSILNKIFHKEDDLGLDDPLSKDSGLNLPELEPHTTPPNMGGAPPLDYNNPDINAQTGTPRPRDYHEQALPQTPQPPSQPTPTIEKDLQIIMAKLDAIKAELDSLQQRVQKIERIAEADQAASKQQPTYGRW